MKWSQVSFDVYDFHTPSIIIGLNTKLLDEHVTDELVAIWTFFFAIFHLLN